MATVGEKIQEIGRNFGHLTLSDEQVEYILWEHTGYPHYWSSEDGATPEECFKTQVTRYFESVTKKK
jgi:hypothetical protein